MGTKPWRLIGGESSIQPLVVWLSSNRQGGHIPKAEHGCKKVVEFLNEKIWLLVEHERRSMKAMLRKCTLAPGKHICHRIARFHLKEGASTSKGVWVDAALLVKEGEGNGKHHWWR